MQPAPSSHHYYQKSRQELIPLIPAGAREVLDVGCASGALGAALKAQRPGLHVRGIEPLVTHAEAARALLDDVMVAHFNSQTSLPPEWPRPDCIIFADVLEHMVDPWGAVKRASALLASGGTLVCSIPNLTHWSGSIPILCGEFAYRDYGVLDRTHVRFFSRRTAIELVESGGLRVLRVVANLDHIEAAFDERRLRGALAKLMSLQDSRTRIIPPPLGRIADLLTQQFLIVAS